MDVPRPESNVWQEAKNAEGRSYYYNTQTKATQWEKPVDLMSAQERALADQPWKEYSAEGGKKYWYNAETKESSWEMPQSFKDALNPPVATAPLPSTPAFVAGGGSSSLGQSQSADRRERPDFNTRDRYDRSNRTQFPDSNLAPSPHTRTDPEFASFEDAESSFMKLLSRSAVRADWSWEQAMKAVIKDPQYRVLRDSRDRRLAFDKYAAQVRALDRERAKERLAKLREDFGKMLRSHSEIKHYTRWKSARPMLEAETIFRSTGDENERHQLFNDYIAELKKDHAEQESKHRLAALSELSDLLQSLKFEPSTRWIDARKAIQADERFVTKEHFRTLTQSDVLAAFSNHVKSLERDHNEIQQAEKVSRLRLERQTRDHFVQLLEELRDAGKIHADSRWSELRPSFEGDGRYVALLGQPGSTPLDLFWDIVEEEDQKIRAPSNDVRDVLEDKRFALTSSTEFEHFLEVIRTDRRTANLDRATISAVYSRLHASAVRRDEEDRSHAERHKKRLIDALRSRIKHLDPPISIDDSWDDVRPRVESLPEYSALDSDDARQAAFDKVIRRLKEKAEDAQRRKTDRDRRDQRDRNLGGRSAHEYRSRGPHDDHTGRLSRSPEPNAYEADRRRAQADRERQHRRHSPSNASGRGAREWDGEMDWERDRGPGSRQVPDHHERDRRDRKLDRERSYKPREARDSLEYDERGAKRRPRRDSRVSDGSPRSSKRVRRDRSPPPRLRRDQSPVIAPVKPEPLEYKSGSEEGEIEEG